MLLLLRLGTTGTNPQGSGTPPRIVVQAPVPKVAPVR